MTPFFTRTGTKRNLAGAREAGWGILVTPTSRRDEGFKVIGADNSQYEERDNTGPFKESRFLDFLDWLGDRALWLAVPDIVCGGIGSLALSLDWLDRLRGHPSILLLVVQDGMTPAMIAPFVGPRVGIFVGGSDKWKEASLQGWGKLAADAGCYLHVGRVNSARRIFLCAAAVADSFDGTSVSRYAKTLPMLDQARRQIDLASKWRDVSDRTPSGFARRCREIVATMPGHQAHRALDVLTNEILRDAGFGAGIEIFEEAVAGWHRDGLPYPLEAEI